mgnify:CR=1
MLERNFLICNDQYLDGFGNLTGGGKNLGE